MQNNHFSENLSVFSVQFHKNEFKTKSEGKNRIKK